ncbi:hypothetical protein C8R43DRAFT_335766 [Mycena crocata]|nr:hypothetical protein C8R43DRAFT_335766 [Mycena crocata]
MQFSLATLFALVAAVDAAPAPLRLRADTCDISTCFLDLAPAGLACTAATAQAEADPITDAGCLLAAAQLVDKLPTSCNGCAAKFGVSGLFDKAKDALESIL